MLTIVHQGHHIADLKTPVPAGETAPLFVGEYNAWTMTVLAAAMSRQQTVGMPGGQLLWNGAWDQNDRNSFIDTAIRDYLGKSAALSQ